MTPLDILPFFLLVTLASGAIGFGLGYILGTQHGYETGYETGAADEIQNSRIRCIQYKRESYNCGKDDTIARLESGKPILRGQFRPTVIPRAKESRADCKTARQMPVSARNS